MVGIRYWLLFSYCLIVALIISLIKTHLQNLEQKIVKKEKSIEYLV